MPLQDLSTPPTAPQRTDDADTFIDRADTFVAWFATFVSEMNTLSAQLEATAALIAVAPAYADVALKTIADSTLTPATDRLPYFDSASSASLATFTAAARTFIAAVDAAAQRTALGLSANGSSLVTAADYAAMRNLLGLVIGTDVQAQDTELAALAGLVSAANKIPRFTGSGTADLIDFLDEDTMSSDSATAVASQQSTKAYIDGAVSGLAATSSGTTSAGYFDLDIGSLGTLRVNWGSNSVGANTSTLVSLSGSYTTAIKGVVGWETSDTTLTDFSTGYLASTTQMRLTNGSGSTMTAQWIALGIV